LQVVGLHADEETLVARWSVAAFLDALASRHPLLVTERERPSLLADAELGPALRRRADAEGSSQSAVFTETLSWKTPLWSSRKIELFLGPIAAVRRNLGSMLVGRTAHGREFWIMGPGHSSLVRAGEPAAWHIADGVLTLTISPALADELREFAASDRLAMQSAALPGFTLRIFD
jgi:hypothetical protein